MRPPPPFRPEAVVFDLDGLLVDSEHLWADAEREVVEGYGRAWSPEVHRRLLGTGPDETAALLGELLGVADTGEVDRRLLAAVRRRFGAGVPLRPGAAALVGRLRGRLPLGVATNSRRVLAELALASAGLDAALDAVVAAEDVTRPKPAPDAYLAACDRLGADPAHSVALEDSPRGAASARAAGLWVIGCPSLPDARPEAAHVLVRSLAEVDPAVLLEAAWRRRRGAVGRST